MEKFIRERKKRKAAKVTAAAIAAGAAALPGAEAQEWNEAQEEAKTRVEIAKDQQEASNAQVLAFAEGLDTQVSILRLFLLEQDILRDPKYLGPDIINQLDEVRQTLKQSIESLKKSISDKDGSEPISVFLTQVSMQTAAQFNNSLMPTICKAVEDGVVPKDIVPDCAVNGLPLGPDTREADKPNGKHEDGEDV